MQKQKEGESGKRWFWAGPILSAGISGLILSFPVIGLILFLLGSFLGIRGLYEDKDENE